MVIFDVFISYPHQDKITADAACTALEAAGVRCWIAPRDVDPGAEWAGAIVDAIDRCRVMVLIFSEHANQSKQIHREVQRAFDKGVPVVPMRIANAVPEKSLAYYMGPVHWLDALSPPLEKHLKQLAATVRALLKTASSEQDVGRESAMAEAGADRYSAVDAVKGAAAFPERPHPAAAPRERGASFDTILALTVFSWKPIETLQQARILKAIGILLFVALAVFVGVYVPATGPDPHMPTLLVIAVLLAGCAVGIYFNSRVVAVVGLAAIVLPPTFLGLTLVYHSGDPGFRLLYGAAFLALTAVLFLGANAGVRGVFASLRFGE